MRANMPPAAYIDQQWFERERDLLFKPLWQFVGLKMMLAKPNAFITRKLCGIPLVVQNFAGELRAFENICLHRQNPLQIDPHGVRPLVCSYHGWGYGSNGAPNNIPFEAQLYRFPEPERACLKLRQFALHCIGNLVFVNLSPEPLPITEQFSEAYIASLAEVSEAFDDEVVLTTYNLDANWKLAYENLRDGHHPRYLHSGSIYQGVKFTATFDEQALAQTQTLLQRDITDREEAMALARSFSIGGPDAPLSNPKHFQWHDNVERSSHHDAYFNWLTFPNLHIASGTGGYSFIIEHHIPVSAGRTDFMVYYVTAKKKRRYAASPAVLHSHMMGADIVLREDSDVMEKIQRTLHADAPNAQVGDYEFLNLGIQHWYLAVMEGKIVL